MVGTNTRMLLGLEYSANAFRSSLPLLTIFTVLFG